MNLQEAWKSTSSSQRLSLAQRHARTK